MIYDCVPFFNELDILKLRMQIMAPYVDFFVIEEASVTFSGEPKRMIFAENRQLFAEFEEKIRYVAVENSPLEGVTTHERDKFQKNQLIRGLSDCRPEDIIIFSDVDEIPNPKTLVRLIEAFEPGKVYHLAQRMFYCFLNMEEVSGNLLSITGEFPGVERRQWLGTKICSFAELPEEGIVYLREVPPEDQRGRRVAFRLYGRRRRAGCGEAYRCESAGGGPFRIQYQTLFKRGGGQAALRRGYFRPGRKVCAGSD